MDAKDSAGGGIEGELYYLLPSSRINRRYISPSGQLNLSAYGPERVFVRNARAEAEACTLDRRGFTLTRHASAVVDFQDRAALDGVYAPEMTELVRALTGAEKVLPFSWMLRNAAPTGAAEQPPANDVHVDHTPAFADRMAERALAWCGLSDAGYSHFFALTVWRALSGAPQDWPLGLCDATSVAADEGEAYPILHVDTLPSVDALPPLPYDPAKPELPEISAFRFNPAHRWYYFADMQPDEVIVFKSYDSRRTGAWRVPHAGFRDPTCRRAASRRSVEMRLLAFFR